MKKILTLLLTLVTFVASVNAQETRSQAISSLMGLGMPGQLATEVAGLATGLAVLPNNTYLVGRNAAGSANINMLKIDSGNDTNLNAATGELVELTINATPALTLSATAMTLASGVDTTITSGSIFGAAVNKPWVNGLSAVPADVTTISTPEMLIFNGTSGGAGLITQQGAADANGTNNSFLKSRATDGSADTIVQNGDIISQLTFYGANGTTFDPAARIKVTVGGVPGASADMPGAIDFQVSADGSATPTNALSIANSGTVTLTNTITSSRTTDLGWAVVSAANQACNTTCTSACVVGQDTGTANVFVGCASATADVCLCAGAS